MRDHTQYLHGLEAYKDRGEELKRNRVSELEMAKRRDEREDWSWEKKIEGG